METFNIRKSDKIKKIETDVSCTGSLVLYVTFKDGKKILYAPSKEVFF
jgi:hypothetical protein